MRTSFGADLSEGVTSVVDNFVSISLDTANPTLHFSEYLLTLHLEIASVQSSHYLQRAGAFEAGSTCLSMARRTILARMIRLEKRDDSARLVRMAETRVSKGVSARVIRIAAVILCKAKYFLRHCGFACVRGIVAIHV